MEPARPGAAGARGADVFGRLADPDGCALRGDSHSHPNSLALFVADRPVLAHLFAAGSLLLETFFPLVLFVPRLRWLFVPGAVSMHLGIGLAMGLDYSALAATVVIVFVDWPVVVAWVRRSAATVPAPGAAPR